MPLNSKRGDHIDPLGVNFSVTCTPLFHNDFPNGTPTIEYQRLKEGKRTPQQGIGNRLFLNKIDQVETHFIISHGCAPFIDEINSLIPGDVHGGDFNHR